MITRYRTETDTYEVNDVDKTFRSINTVGVATEWEPYILAELWDFDPQRAILRLRIPSGQNVLTPTLTRLEVNVTPLEAEG